MAAMLFPRDAIDDGAPNPRGKTLVVVNIILVIISSFLVAARWATRITIHRKLGSDDYAILGALVRCVNEPHHLINPLLTAYVSSQLPSQ